MLDVCNESMSVPDIPNTPDDFGEEKPGEDADWDDDEDYDDEEEEV